MTPKPLDTAKLADDPCEKLQAYYNDLLALQDQVIHVPIDKVLDAVGLALAALRTPPGLDARTVELPDDIDPECRPICEAMNLLPGIQTVESCCGHGERPFWIFFLVDTIPHLLTLLREIDRPWMVRTYWSNGGDHAMFLLEGPIGAQANDLAEAIRTLPSVQIGGHLHD